MQKNCDLYSKKCSTWIYLPSSIWKWTETCVCLFSRLGSGYVFASNQNSGELSHWWKQTWVYTKQTCVNAGKVIKYKMVLPQKAKRVNTVTYSTVKDWVWVSEKHSVINHNFSSCFWHEQEIFCIPAHEKFRLPLWPWAMSFPMCFEKLLMHSKKMWSSKQATAILGLVKDLFL